MPISIYDRDGGGERDNLSPYHYPVILAYYYRLLAIKCIRLSYFLVTVCINIYIYEIVCVADGMMLYTYTHTHIYIYIYKIVCVYNIIPLATESNS